MVLFAPSYWKKGVWFVYSAICWHLILSSLKLSFHALLVRGKHSQSAHDKEPDVNSVLWFKIQSCNADGILETFCEVKGVGVQHQSSLRAVQLFSAVQKQHCNERLLPDTGGFLTANWLLLPARSSQRSFPEKVVAPGGEGSQRDEPQRFVPPPQSIPWPAGMGTAGRLKARKTVSKTDLWNGQQGERCELMGLVLGGCLLNSNECSSSKELL